MAAGYVPVDDPPGTAPLPAGKPAPGLKSGGAPDAARARKKRRLRKGRTATRPAGGSR